jgi:transcriptional regulator with XRE-family HTH domain
MIASPAAISPRTAAPTSVAQPAASPAVPVSRHAPVSQQVNAQTIATNVRRLMARDGLKYVDVVEATGLDERTVRGLVRGANNPHARTLHKFAQGLGIPIDELFQPVDVRARQAFDRATNPLVQGVVESNAELFSAWSPADFDELYSQFGHGGPLCEEGVVAAAEAINAKRSLLRKVSVILESSESELLADFVRLLYRRATENDCRPVGAHVLTADSVPGVETPGVG